MKLLAAAFNKTLRYSKSSSVLLLLVVVVSTVGLLYLSHPIAARSVLMRTECSLDYINNHRVPQDDPCVIAIIRRDYLHRPSPRSVPYSIPNDNTVDPSAGQSTYILRVLKNKTEGFFVESGAMDGDALSNTLYMERYLGWSGILIEANPHNYAELLKRNRKSWTLPVCLSIESYPTRVSFVAGLRDYVMVGHIDKPGTLQGNWDKPGEESEVVSVQCFPLYSILLAVGRTKIDYFSLDIEGHELSVLKTVPWHKVDIKTLTVEWEHIPEGDIGLTTYMESIGYIQTADLELPNAFDLVYIKDRLNVD